MQGQQGQAGVGGGGGGGGESILSRVQAFRRRLRSEARHIRALRAGTGSGEGGGGGGGGGVAGTGVGGAVGGFWGGQKAGKTVLNEVESDNVDLLGQLEVFESTLQLEHAAEEEQEQDGNGELSPLPPPPSPATELTDLVREHQLLRQQFRCLLMDARKNNPDFADALASTFPQLTAQTERALARSSSFTSVGSSVSASTQAVGPRRASMCATGLRPITSLRAVFEGINDPVHAPLRGTGLRAANWGKAKKPVMVRGRSYMWDNVKVPSRPPLFRVCALQMVKHTEKLNHIVTRFSVNPIHQLARAYYDIMLSGELLEETPRTPQDRPNSALSTGTADQFVETASSARGLGTEGPTDTNFDDDLDDLDDDDDGEDDGVDGDQFFDAMSGYGADMGNATPSASRVASAVKGEGDTPSTAVDASSIAPPFFLVFNFQIPGDDNMQFVIYNILREHMARNLLHKLREHEQYGRMPLLLSRNPTATPPRPPMGADEQQQFDEYGNPIPPLPPGVYDPAEQAAVEAMAAHEQLEGCGYGEGEQYGDGGAAAAARSEVTRNHHQQQQQQHQQQQQPAAPSSDDGSDGGAIGDAIGGAVGYLMGALMGYSDVAGNADPSELADDTDETAKEEAALRKRQARAWEDLLFALWVGDDEFRNNRLKLIPNVTEGPWVVRTMIANKPTILGRKLAQTYFREDNLDPETIASYTPPPPPPATPPPDMPSSVSSPSFLHKGPGSGLTPRVQHSSVHTAVQAYRRASSAGVAGAASATAPDSAPSAAASAAGTGGGSDACMTEEELPVPPYSYLEVDIDVGSSSIAANVLRLVRDYSKNLCVDVSWTMQGDQEEELPERVLCSTHFKRVDFGTGIAATVRPPQGP